MWMELKVMSMSDSNNNSFFYNCTCVLVSGIVGLVLGAGLVGLIFGRPSVPTPANHGDSNAIATGEALMLLLPLGGIVGGIIGIVWCVVALNRKAKT